MKVHTRIVGECIRKLYCITGTATGKSVNVFTRITLLQFNRQRFSTLSKSDVHSETSLRKSHWRILFFGTDDFALPSLKMLFREM